MATRLAQAFPGHAKSWQEMETAVWALEATLVTALVLHSHAYMRTTAMLADAMRDLCHAHKANPLPECIVLPGMTFINARFPGSLHNVDLVPFMATVHECARIKGNNIMWSVLAELALMVLSAAAPHPLKRGACTAAASLMRWLLCEKPLRRLLMCDRKLDGITPLRGCIRKMQTGLARLGVAHFVLPPVFSLCYSTDDEMASGLAAIGLSLDVAARHDDDVWITYQDDSDDGVHEEERLVVDLSMRTSTMLSRIQADPTFARKFIRRATTGRAATTRRVDTVNPKEEEEEVVEACQEAGWDAAYLAEACPECPVCLEVPGDEAGCELLVLDCVRPTGRNKGPVHAVCTVCWRCMVGQPQPATCPLCRRTCAPLMG